MTRHRSWIYLDIWISLHIQIYPDNIQKRMCFVCFRVSMPSTSLVFLCFRVSDPCGVCVFPCFRVSGYPTETLTGAYGDGQAQHCSQPRWATGHLWLGVGVRWCRCGPYRGTSHHRSAQHCTVGWRGIGRDQTMHRRRILGRNQVTSVLAAGSSAEWGRIGDVRPARNRRTFIQ